MPAHRSLGETFTWHPAVHKRFGEHLAFFLVRLPDSIHKPVASQLREILADAKVLHACEYTIFGYWDGLVRVWLNPSVESRLRAAFQRAQATVQYFRAEHIYYFWADPPGDLLAPDQEVGVKIAELEDQIRFAIENPAHQEEAVWKELLAGDVLLERRHRMDENSVKFYVVLSRNHRQVESELQHVFDAISDSGLESSASLYVGNGEFASYLVRCVSGTYRDVLELSASLDTNLDKTSLRPMTLLIANADALESDNVNDLHSLTPDDQTTFSLLELTPGSEAILAKLSGDRRDALHRLVKVSFRVPSENPNLGEKLRRVLRACLEDDENRLVEAMSFLLNSDDLIARYLKQVWGEFYADWPSELATEIPGVKQSQIDSTRWSLNWMKRVAVSSAEVNEQVARRFAEQLGDSWSEQLSVLVDIRNVVAHVRRQEFDDVRDFGGVWGEIMGQIVDASTLRFRVEQALNGAREGR